MNLSNPVLHAIAKLAFETALKTLAGFMAQADFKEVVDLILNKVESTFDEGTRADMAAEALTQCIRDDLGIVDSDPDN
jgi:hypothetical protein